LTSDLRFTIFDAVTNTTLIMKKLFLFLSTGFFLLSIPAISQTFWEDVPLPEPVSAIWALDVNASGTLFMGSQNDIYYSSDNGDNWTESNNWPGYTPSCIGFNSSNHIFTGTLTNGIFRSDDGGQNFTEINNGLTFLNVWDILVMPNDDLLIGGPGGIFRSTDNGNQWALFGTGLPNDEIEKIVRAENGTLFSGTYGSGIYRSFDEGSSWAACNNGLPVNAQVTALLTVPGGDVFAGIWPEGMFLSTDNGDSWTDINQGLPLQREGSVDDLTFSVSASFTYSIGAFHLQGVYYYYYGSDMESPGEWIPINDGLPDDPTTTVLATNPDNIMFLGTWDQGLFRTAWVLPTPGHEVNIAEYGLYVSPNPFRFRTDIMFQVPGTERVTIQAFNFIGQVINVITDKTYSKGSYKITWEPEGVAPGLYYIKFQSGNYSTSRKVIFAE